MNTLKSIINLKFFGSWYFIFILSFALMIIKDIVTGNFDVHPHLIILLFYTVLVYVYNKMPLRALLALFVLIPFAKTEIRAPDIETGIFLAASSLFCVMYISYKAFTHTNKETDAGENSRNL